jgi:hypothetical protein
MPEKLMTLEQLTTGEKTGSISFMGLTSKVKGCTFCSKFTTAVCSVYLRDRNTIDTNLVGRACQKHRDEIKEKRTRLKIAKSVKPLHVLAKRASKQTLNPFFPR